MKTQTTKQEAVASIDLFSLLRITDMTPKIINAIDALVAALREESPEQMTTFRLFVNCEEWVIETSERTPAQLKDAGISMRNLRGDFIRENGKTERQPPTVTVEHTRRIRTATQC